MQRAFPLKELLESVVEELGVGNKLAECHAKLVWGEVVGPILARQAIPLRVRSGRLEVAVASAVWRNQLSFLQEDIIKKINRLVGKDVVIELVLLNQKV